uniref:G protein-coupled receptor n=1 Tax=Panagrellus redivivus TaxID=6233 RepID=A0A7E4V0N4_PANRE
MSTQVFYVIVFIGLAICVHSLWSIFLSLVNRFVFLFHPHWQKYLHNKYTIFYIIFCHTFFDLVYAAGCWRSLMNHDAMEQRARSDYGNTLEKWFKEPSFIYVPEFYGITRTFGFAGFILLVIVFFLFVGIAVWFIVNVFIYKKASKTLNDHSAFLLIAVLAQTGCFLVFMYIPSMVVVYCWTLAVDNSANVVNSVAQLMTIHGTVEMVTMLYFITPYKIYCVKCV